MGAFPSSLLDSIQALADTWVLLSSKIHLFRGFSRLTHIIHEQMSWICHSFQGRRRFSFGDRRVMDMMVENGCRTYDDEHLIMLSVASRDKAPGGEDGAMIRFRCRLSGRVLSPP